MANWFGCVHVISVLLRIYNKFAGENEEQLRQEIGIIEELLAEQPDSKCKSVSLSCFVFLRRSQGAWTR